MAESLSGKYNLLIDSQELFSSLFVEEVNSDFYRCVFTVSFRLDIDRVAVICARRVRLSASESRLKLLVLVDVGGGDAGLAAVSLVGDRVVLVCSLGTSIATAGLVQNLHLDLLALRG